MQAHAFAARAIRLCCLLVIMRNTLFRLSIPIAPHRSRRRRATRISHSFLAAFHHPPHRCPQFEREALGLTVRLTVPARSGCAVSSLRLPYQRTVSNCLSTLVFIRFGQRQSALRPIPHSVRGTVGCQASRGFVLWRVADAGWRRLWLRLSWPASATLHICYDRRRWIRRQPCPLTGVSRSLSKIDLLGDLGGRLPPLCRSNLLISRQVAVFTRPRPTANLRRPT
jgi:hypothetical protein